MKHLAWDVMDRAHPASNCFVHPWETMLPWYNSSRIDTKTNIKCFGQDFKTTIVSACLVWFVEDNFLQWWFPSPASSFLERIENLSSALHAILEKHRGSNSSFSKTFLWKSTIPPVSQVLLHLVCFRNKDFGLNDSIFAVLSIRVSFESNMNMMKLGVILVLICRNKRKHYTIFPLSIKFGSMSWYRWWRCFKGGKKRKKLWNKSGFGKNKEQEPPDWFFQQLLRQQFKEGGSHSVA